MNIIQIGSGGSATLPAGPLRVRIDGRGDLELVLTDASGAEVAPDGRQGRADVLLAPTSCNATVSARPAGQGPFPRGATLGATVMQLAFPDAADVVRRPHEVGGRSLVHLLTLRAEGGAIVVKDAFEPVVDVGDAQIRQARPMSRRPWQQAGDYALHRHTDGRRLQPGAWAMVIDGSASMRHAALRDDLPPLIEAVYGIVAAARSGGPEAVLITTSTRTADITEQFDAERVDWSAVFDQVPAPWARLTPAVDMLATRVGPGGLVVLISDGVPVDVRDLFDWLTRNDSIVVRHIVLGRSLRDIDALARPAALWEDELGILAQAPGDAYRCISRHSAAMTNDAMVALAAALEVSS